MDIDEGDVGHLALDEIQRLAGIRCASGRKSVLDEGRSDQLADDRIVVDHEHSTARTHVRSHSDPAVGCKKRTVTSGEINIDDRPKPDMRLGPYGLTRGSTCGRDPA